MKKRQKAAPASKRARNSARHPYPDNDPEWEQLEQRYSQFGDEMRKLAGLIPH